MFEDAANGPGPSAGRSGAAQRDFARQEARAPRTVGQHQRGRWRPTPATLPVTAAPSGQQQLHRLALIRVPMLPFGGERREAFACVTGRARRASSAMRRGEQAVASIGGARRPATCARSVTGCAMSALALSGSRTLRPMPITRDRRTQRVAVELDEDAADLEVPVDEVVRPLERDVGEALVLEARGRPPPPPPATGRRGSRRPARSASPAKNVRLPPATAVQARPRRRGRRSAIRPPARRRGASRGRSGA